MPGRPRRPQIYRIFQHRRAPGLCCAIREGLSIPSFVAAHGWNFGAEVRENGSLPFDFQLLPAREASAAFGYYLFHHPCETLSPRCSRPWGGKGSGPAACNP
ncbi:hypothetical protein [Methylobacterium sp. WCS2018Hpa-22]|uniref:hypothetical protein n=1 Tax=Methylobacterium sp. WCS2018Hpa-22 TaxID=3073633 RepID=UPI0028898B5E|nr:hypothetical protein [Methylobacterium sp. WCS2018Hpa-22]